MKIDFEEIKSEMNKQYIRPIKINWSKHADYIKTIAEIIDPDFDIDDDNKDVLKELLLYFTGNDEFNGSLKKGIMLIGGVGTGKTLLFRIFKTYTQSLRCNSFQEYTSHEITSNLNTEGIEYLRKFGENVEGNKAYPITCYIDDLFSNESKVKHFGTDIDVIHKLIDLRYLIFQKYKTITHTTSNIYPSELKSYLDNRDIDRITEMFNFIELKGESRRK